MLSALARWAARPRHSLFCRATASLQQNHVRAYVSYPADRKPPDKENYNTSDLPYFGGTDEEIREHLSYPLVSSNDLASSSKPPRRAKMLVRDFIEDSLYNPHYGYFPRQATIFSSPETTSAVGMDFSKLRDANEFQALVARRYEEYGMEAVGPGRQIFHTPTELFRPWYAQAVANCLMSEYLLKYFPYEDFLIYEIGAGNGTLALDILDFLQDRHPEVYERTTYTIIEISESLSKRQRELLKGRHDCARVVHKSIFAWEKKEPAPCYVVAMEVIDNFAHDLVRYNLKTLEPYQAVIAVDENGDFFTHYTRVSDPLVASFLALRTKLAHPPPLPKPLLRSPTLRALYSSLPFAPNLSQPDYLPTRLLSLLRTLRAQFPRHRLLLSDFASLPDTLPGRCAPVVQTRIGSTMVATRSLTVQQGYFDIFFPTDFAWLRDMYEYILSQPVPVPAASQAQQGMLSAELPSPARPTPLWSSVSPLALGAEFFSASNPKNRRSPVDGVVSSSGLPVGERKSSVFTHREFMETYGEAERTKLRNGENPMLDFYRNVKFLF